MLNVRITASLVLYKNEKVDVENICRLICGEKLRKECNLLEMSVG